MPHARRPSALLVAVLAIALVPTVPATGDGASKISPRLAASLASDPPTGLVHVIVETGVPTASAAMSARAMGIPVEWTYSIIDAFSAHVTPDQLDALARQDWVAMVWDSRSVTTLMDVSAQDVQAPAAWNAGYNGAGITVAVIDTGIEILDPAFAGAIVSCVSTIGGLALPECDDTDGHGTHVSGSVASRDTTYRGIAWGASLAAVRVLHAAGTGTSADIIAGMDWVRNNRDAVSPPIRVATMSIGFLDPGCGNGNDPEAKAADALVAAGVPFTIAAGNAGHNGCTVDGASAAFNVITVGAVDDRNTADPADDVLAGFSSGGPTQDGRLKPEVSAPGVEIWSVFLGPTIAALDGTSMATPHVAGAIADLLQKEPTLSPAQVKTRIIQGAVRPDAAGSLPDNDWGHGVLNVCNTLGLTGCATSAPPIVVHVDSITMSFAHGNGGGGANKHTVTSVVTVRDDGGALASGISVGLRLTSPEGNQYTLSGTTGSAGTATPSKTQAGGGHGTWQACVTSLSGTYDQGANVETCDTLNVT